MWSAWWHKLHAVADNRGFMTQNGQPDNPRSARYILKDFVKGKLMYCHAPPTHKQTQYHVFPERRKQSSASTLPPLGVRLLKVLVAPNVWREFISFVSCFLMILKHNILGSAHCLVFYENHNRLGIGSVFRIRWKKNPGCITHHPHCLRTSLPRRPAEFLVLVVFTWWSK